MGNGICEQCALEQTRSPGEKDARLDCICKSCQCRGSPPWDHPKAASWDLVMRVTQLVMEVVLT